MFSVRQKREIADAVQKILRDTGHPELPQGEIRFLLHVSGVKAWSWADIRNNGDVMNPGVNLHNEAKDGGKDMTYKYILNGHDAVKEPDPIKWLEWFETADRKVRKDTAKVSLKGRPIGNIDISTVFLGIDHNFGDGKPLLFETMVFGGPLDQECERCSTWEAAEQMHEKMCEKVKLAIKSE